MCFITEDMILSSVNVIFKILLYLINGVSLSQGFERYDLDRLILIVSLLQTECVMLSTHKFMSYDCQIEIQVLNLSLCGFMSRGDSISFSVMELVI